MGSQISACGSMGVASSDAWPTGASSTYSLTCGISASRSRVSIGRAFRPLTISSRVSRDPRVPRFSSPYFSPASGDTGLGRLRSVSRDSLLPAPNDVARSTVVYDVPLTGAGAPYQMGEADVNAWAQDDVAGWRASASIVAAGSANLPASATAIFPADQRPPDAPAAPAGDGYGRATVQYLNARGQVVNAASPGGHISVSEYGRHGNVIRGTRFGSGQARTAKLTSARPSSGGRARSPRLTRVRRPAPDPWPRRSPGRPCRPCGAPGRPPSARACRRPRRRSRAWC